jgi:2-keto-3-deoxy-galactonokinase
MRLPLMLVLMGEMEPEALPDYLSGILIGVEVASVMGTFASDLSRLILLIGDDDLCRRYRWALESVGIEPVRAGEDATVRGHVRIAREAGIVGRLKDRKCICVHPAISLARFIGSSRTRTRLQKS